MLIQDNEIKKLTLIDSFIVKPKIFEDHRGIFYKLYNEKVLENEKINLYFAEEYLSISRKGVLRGLHYQKENFAQAKLIRCSKGRIFDVIIDLRKKSPTFGKWEGVYLSETNMLSLYAPRGFAHGFLALDDVVHVVYKADNTYSPEYEAGLVYDDPKLNIIWPGIEKISTSEKDKSWPNFESCYKFT